MELKTLAGNPRIRQSLENRRGGLPHACLISGPAGSGRHTLSWLLCGGMLCQAEEENRPCGTCGPCKKVAGRIHPDVCVIRGPEEGKPITVGQIREMRADAYIRPNEGVRKVYILEGVDELRAEAQNAMLKLLEEGPEYAAFLLLCENPGGVLQTIRSRCEQFPLSPVSLPECEAYLSRRFPEKTPAEIRAAAQNCQGILGRAVEELEGAGEENTRKTEQAVQLSRILAEGDELSVLEAVTSLEKLNREEWVALLSRLEVILTERLGRGTGDRKRILRCVELCRELRGAAMLNANPGQLSGWLCAGMFV